MVERYLNVSGKSGIAEYEIGADFIRVFFSSGTVYVYTYESAGELHIENMKRLAQMGEFLNTYINRHVYGKYDPSQTEIPLPKQDERPENYQEYSAICDDGEDIAGYEIGDDFIRLFFVGGSIYLYTYKSAGKENIEEMKKRAQEGNGLLDFVRMSVYSAYEKREKFVPQKTNYNPLYRRRHRRRRWW